MRVDLVVLVSSRAMRSLCLSTAPPTSTQHIVKVIGVCARIHMCRINTSLVVAVVAEDTAFFNRPVFLFPEVAQYADYPRWTPASAYHWVAASTQRPRPHQAIPFTNNHRGNPLI